MNIDQIDLNIYECNSCKKYFGVGIDFYLWNYLYKPKGISFNEAFEIYSKELKEKGATAIHLKEKPEVCPYCKQTSFDIAKIKLADPNDFGLETYKCNNCLKIILQGIFEYFRLQMVAMGITKYTEIFKLYKMQSDLVRKENVFLVSKITSCPNCKASKKQIKLVPERYKFF